jgi:tryptophan synthase alpha chain
MNRISETFEKLKKTGGKAFVAYLTSGYPDLGTTENLVLELASRGVSVIELGVPFSDPLADGPTIQEASQKALLNDVTLDKIFSMVKKVRRRTQIPLVIMTYYNPVYQYGIQRFARMAGSAGLDGIIIPDLPPEESGSLKAALGRYDLSLIFLLASNSPPDRMKLVAGESEGFVYCLSHIGITGARKGLEQGLKLFLEKVRRVTDKPLVVGFGISRREHVRKVNKWADGVVVGSAIIEVIKANVGKKNLVKKVGDYVSGLMET